MTPDQVLSLSSLYLALVGLLSTFFFINLTEWINSIIGLHVKWDEIREKDKLKEYDHRLECYKEANEHASKWTRNTWFAISGFILITFVLQLFLILGQKPEDRCGLIIFVVIPTFIFLIIYFSYSIIILCKGYNPL